MVQLDEPTAIEKKYGLASVDGLMQYRKTCHERHDFFRLKRMVRWKYPVLRRGGKASWRA
jgi:hypothetical protein